MFVMNLSARFCLRCSLIIDVLDIVLSGTVGYMSADSMVDL